MKIINDINEFHHRTGLIVDLEFESIDLIPNGLIGIFDQHRLSELMSFCNENPQYHVISFLKHAPIKVNTAIHTAAFYMLGEGDNDPDLMCVPIMDKDTIIELKTLEFDIG